MKCSVGLFKSYQCTKRIILYQYYKKPQHLFYALNCKYVYNWLQIYVLCDLNLSRCNITLNLVLEKNQTLQCLHVVCLWTDVCVRKSVTNGQRSPLPMNVIVPRHNRLMPASLFPKVIIIIGGQNGDCIFFYEALLVLTSLCTLVSSGHHPIPADSCPHSN